MTNENIQNLVAAKLESYSNGIGKTSDLPKTFNFTSENDLTTPYGNIHADDVLIRAKFIQQLDKDFKKLTEEKCTALVAALNAGFIDNAHQKYGQGENKPVSLPPKRLLTAEEYKASIISQASIDSTALFDQIETLLHDKSVTKDKLIHFITELQNVLFPADKVETYKVMTEKENEYKHILESLAGFGFTDIKPNADNTFSGNIPMADLQVTMGTIAGSFEIVGTPVTNFTTFMVSLTVKSKN